MLHIKSQKKENLAAGGFASFCPLPAKAQALRTEAAFYTDPNRKQYGVRFLKVLLLLRSRKQIYTILFGLAFRIGGKNLKFQMPAPRRSLQHIRLSPAHVHSFSTGQAYTSSNTVVFLYSGICKPNRTGREKQMALKGREKRRSGRKGGGGRREQKEDKRKEKHIFWFCFSHLSQHSPCRLPARSLANTAASDKEQPLSYSGGPFHVPYCKLY